MTKHEKELRKLERKLENLLIKFHNLRDGVIVNIEYTGRITLNQPYYTLEINMQCGKANVVPYKH